MNNQILKKIALALSILLFIMPVIATLIIAARSTPEARQYAGLQVILMGIYNSPFLLVSTIAFVTGRSYQGKSKEKASNISFTVSIGSSVIGSILMLVWGLGTL